MVQLSATMEQTREMQLAQLYDVLGLRLVIARYDVLCKLHETGPSWYGARSFQVTMVIVSISAVQKYDDVQLTQRTFVNTTRSINVPKSD